MPVHRQLHYSGRVQGVGFRYSVRQIAAGYEVVGSVRNLPDGRVEVLASGEPGEIEAFLKAIAESHLRAHIRTVEQAEAAPPAAKTGGFVIQP